MKQAALLFALCALTAPAAVGQQSTIDVQASGRNVSLPVQITPASSEKIAHAAAERAAEPDGVMIVPIPESNYVLRTEKFNATGHVTTMTPADAQSPNTLFSDSICTTRWNAGNTAHSLVSTLGKDENMSTWSNRHNEALMLITAIYPPTGNNAATPATTTQDAAGNRDIAKTPWTDASGNTNEVATKRRDNEDKDAWMARHQQAVKAFAAVMPPKA